MAEPNTDVAIGVLQASILAVPFWLASVQYWLNQYYNDNPDERFNIASVLLGSGASVGLISLILAIRWSTDAITEVATSDISVAVSLIDLFGIVAFGMLVASMAEHMTRDTPKLTAIYSIIFAFSGPLVVSVYIFSSGSIVLLGIGVLMLLLAVYYFLIRPVLVSHTRREAGGRYPVVGAITIGAIHRIIHREKMPPITPEKERRIRRVSEQMGESGEAIQATIEELRKRYGVKRELPPPEEDKNGEE